MSSARVLQARSGALLLGKEQQFQRHDFSFTLSSFDSFSPYILALPILLSFKIKRTPNIMYLLVWKAVRRVLHSRTDNSAHRVLSMSDDPHDPCDCFEISQTIEFDTKISQHVSWFFIFTGTAYVKGCVRDRKLMTVISPKASPNQVVIPVVSHLFWRLVLFENDVHSMHPKGPHQQIFFDHRHGSQDTPATRRRWRSNTNEGRNAQWNFLFVTFSLSFRWSCCLFLFTYVSYVGFSPM